MSSPHAVLLQTVQFAAEKHKGQRRKDAASSPYINHPIGVAGHIQQIGQVDDLVALQGAILHDTVEDTDTTFEELEKHFGKTVADVVREVTDDKSLAKDERKKLQVAHVTHASYPARLIKLADKLNNLTDILSNPPVGWSAKRIQGYFIWSKKVVDAARGTNKQLEVALDNTFASNFTLHGISYPTIPSGNSDVLLDEYYQDMATASN